MNKQLIRVIAIIVLIIALPFPLVAEEEADITFFDIEPDEQETFFVFDDDEPRSKAEDVPIAQRPFTLLGGITWFTSTEDAKAIVENSGFSRHLIYFYRLIDGSYTYQKGSLFGAEVNSMSLTYENDVLDHINVGYKANKSSFEAVTSSITSEYGDPSKGLYQYVAGIEPTTFTVPAMIWAASDATFYLSADMPTNNLDDVRDGKCGFVVNIRKAYNPHSASSGEMQTLNTAPQSSNEFIFRNGLKFGMSRGEAIRIEGECDEVMDNAMLYKTTASGLDAMMFLVFDNNKLVSIAYLFTENRSVYTEQIDNYILVQEALIEKYGIPAVGETSWEHHSDHVKLAIGLTLATEEEQVSSLWKLPNVTISHTLSGKDQRISHMLIYALPNVSTTPRRLDGI